MNKKMEMGREIDISKNMNKKIIIIRKWARQFKRDRKHNNIKKLGNTRSMKRRREGKET